MENHSKKKLYKLETPLGQFYVIAEDLNEAENLLTDMLTEADYGFHSDRKITKIEIMAQEINSMSNKPNFSSKNTLIIADNWI